MASDCRETRVRGRRRSVRRHETGVSLVEQVVGLALMGVIVGIGLPNISEYLQNRQVRSATESLVGGLQFARAEAIRRNEVVDLALNSGAWAVTSQATGEVLGRRAAEETPRARILVDGDADAVHTFSFNGTGRIVSGNAERVIDVTHANGCLPSGAYRCLRIRMSSGGTTRSCDPQAPLGSPQACVALATVSAPPLPTPLPPAPPTVPSPAPAPAPTGLPAPN